MQSEKQQLVREVRASGIVIEESLEQPEKQLLPKEEMFLWSVTNSRDLQPMK